MALPTLLNRRVARRLPVAACAVALAVAPVARAMVFRDDVGSLLARNVTSQDQFAATGKVNDAAGSGTLIAPDWVLTSKQATGTATAGSFTLGGVAYTGQVYASPTNDLSLIHLTSGSVPTATARPITPGFFGNDAGGLVWLAGYGRYSTVNGTGGTVTDGNLRAGTNVVRELAGPYLYTDNANTAPTSSLYEANAATGDTGGPMYRQVNNAWYVIGAASGTATGGFVHTPTAPNQSFILDTIRTVSGNAGFTFATPAGPTALTWDADPNVDGVQTGDGTWDAQRPNFRDPVTGFNHTYDNAMANDVTFGSSGGTITIASTNLASGTLNAGGVGPAYTAGGVSAHSLTFSGLPNAGTVNRTGSAGLTLVNNGTSDPSITSNVTGILGVTLNVPIASTAATITKLGTGTLTLNGVNTYTGTFAVAAGAVIANAPTALPGHGDGRLTVASGATLQLAVGTTPANFQLADVDRLISLGALAPGSTLALDTRDTMTYAGQLPAGLGFQKFGTATLTLTAAQNYTGSTLLRAGSLTLSGAGRLPDAAPIVFSGGGLVLGPGVVQTVGTLRPETPGSTFVVSGTGTLVAGPGFTMSNVRSTSAGAYIAYDFSKLAAFVYDQPTALNVNGGQCTANLAPTTTITAPALRVGTADDARIGTFTTTLTTGTTATTLNLDEFWIGNTAALGTFTSPTTTGTGPVGTLTLRGQAGGDSRAGRLVVGYTSSLTTSAGGRFDVRNQTLDLRVNELVIADYEPNATVTSINTISDFSMTYGTLDANTITIGYTRPGDNGSGGGATGAFFHNGGLVRVGSLVMGASGNLNGGSQYQSARYNVGSAALQATLAAREIVAGPNATNAVNGSVARALNLGNGRVTTLDADTDLAIRGLPGGGVGGPANKTLNVVLSPTGLHALTAPAGRSITVETSAPISGSGALAIDGAGTVVLQASNSYTGGTVVTNGTLRVNAAARTPLLTGNGTDLRNGRVIFGYATPAENPAAAIRSLLATGRAANFAAGVLRSSTATAGRGLGYADNGTGVTVQTTLYGDADLDGGVSINDFNALSANFGRSTGRVWTDGDFDYDGGVSINDFNLLAGGFGQSGAATGELWAGLLAFAAAHDDMAAFEAVTGVPEPAGVALAAIGLTLGVRRRRRA